MGNRIKIREFDIDITLPPKALIEAFQPGSSKVETYQSKGEVGVKVINITEQGWIGIWARIVDEENLCIYAYGSSATFYSRNGRWFLDTLKQLAVDYKGNLLLVTREPDTGGGQTTIISQGEIIFGCFSKKLGSPYGFRSMWKSKYDPRKDVDKPIEVTIHDIAQSSEETIRIDPA